MSGAERPTSFWSQSTPLHRNAISHAPDRPVTTLARHHPPAVVDACRALAGTTAQQRPRFAPTAERTQSTPARRSSFYCRATASRLLTSIRRSAGRSRENFAGWVGSLRVEGGGRVPLGVPPAEQRLVAYALDLDLSGRQPHVATPSPMQEHRDTTRRGHTWRTARPMRPGAEGCSPAASRPRRGSANARRRGAALRPAP